MQVLPIFPLYPNSRFLKYNVSLAIPGPKLYDIPSIGKFAQRMGYPNTKSSILLPDIEYIKKFASYDMGIADALLKTAQQQNLSRIKNPTESGKEIFDSFNSNFASNTQDGMGLKSLEKTILSSIFESQKPYFEIAQAAIKSVIVIEDIIARIAPLFGAGINPTMAKSIKSRKPKGNGPFKTGNNPLGVGKYGSPVAIGYKNAEEVKKNLNKLKTLSNKGNKVEVNSNGEATITQPIIASQSTDNNYEYRYIYATVSTVYSTGQFDPNIDYQYKYIDIEDDFEPVDAPIEPDKIVDDISPDRLILGIFDSTGTPIDPRSKIKFWGIDQVGNLEKQDSIFEKAAWLYNSDKWIFSKSVDYPNSYNWQTLSEDNYHWGYFPSGYASGIYTNQIIIQKNSPGTDWYRLKYGDVIDFSIEENQLYDFKKDDYIISFNQSSISDYVNFFNSIADVAIAEKNINSADANIIKSNVSPLYNNQKITEQLQNLSKFGLLKDSYYTKVEDIDWNNYHSDPAPLQTFPNDIRQVFKPMRFNIGSKEIWIDPETQYDIKVVRIDSTKKVDYTLSNSVNSANIGTYSKNSEIKDFIKNNLEITVSELSIPVDFNIEVYKNSTFLESRADVNVYNLYNWNYEFDNSTNIYNKSDSNVYGLVLYYDYDKVPNIFSNYTERGPDPQYTENRNNNWIIESYTFDSVEEVPYIIINQTGYSSFKKIKYEYYTDRVINPTALQSTSQVAGVLSNKLRISWTKSANSDGYVINYRLVGDPTWNVKSVLPNFSSIDIYGIGFDPSLNYEILVQSIEYHKRHIKSIISVTDNIYDLEGFKLEVISDSIIKWIFLYENYSQNFLPQFFTKKSLNINIINNGQTFLENPVNKNIILSDQISTISKFTVKIDAESSILDSTSILNSRLESLGDITNQYSLGRYGDGYQGGVVKDESGNDVKDENGNTVIEPDSPMFVGYAMRNQLTELDNETFFIIEGVKRDKNEDKNKDPEDILLNGVGQSPSGGGYYKIRDAIGITSELIKMIISISTDLVPSITKLINLIKNPASFVTEIIKLKTEKFFSILNPKVTDLISELPNLSQRVKSASNDDDRRDRVKEMRNKIKKTEMSNYIYVNDIGDFKFLLDGTALIGFFGILFGVKLDISNAFNGVVPIKPIFQANQPIGNLEFLLRNLNIKKEVSNTEVIGSDFPEKDTNILSHIDFSKEDKFVRNKTLSSDGNVQYYEEVSIQYSTGEFVSGINYKYIYITQEIEKIIYEADELINRNANIEYNVNSDSVLEDIDSAIAKYEEAYDLVNKLDKDNNSLKKLILSKIKELKSKINDISQPIMKMLLGIVTLPLKIVFEIIKWLLDFFKSLTDPTKIPDQMKEFLSFKWIMEFFSPKGILEMAGIKFNPEKISEWCKASRAKNPLYGIIPGTSEYLIPDDYEISDLNDFLSISFAAKLPIYTALQYRELCLKPMRLFSSFLCLFERIINSFIMLVWSIMGITAIIPPPLIKLCKKINENIEEKDFNDIFNGLFKDDTFSVGSLDSNGDGESYDFLYDIKLPDGSIKRNLNRKAIQDFIDNNKDINFDYLNFETIE